MRHAALIGACVLSTLLGLWHFWLAMQAVFVFREGEPVTSWLAIFLGPGITLVLGILAMFMRRVGGIALVACGTLSLLFFAVGADPSDEISGELVVAFLLRVSLPMVAIGVAFLALSRNARSGLPIAP